MAVYAAISELGSQCAMSAPLKAGIEYLSQFDPILFQDKLPGFSEKVYIDGDGVYATHQIYETKPGLQARFEAHRRYIDIQTIWSGEELIYVAGLKGLKVLTPYDSEKDIEFFSFFGAAALLMKPGVAAVLSPPDAHAPCISSGKPGIVAKTVVKVRV